MLTTALPNHRMITARETFRDYLQTDDLWAISDLDETFRVVLRRRTKIFEQYTRLHDEMGVVCTHTDAHVQRAPQRRQTTC